VIYRIVLTVAARRRPGESTIHEAGVATHVQSMLAQSRASSPRRTAKAVVARLSASLKDSHRRGARFVSIPNSRSPRSSPATGRDDHSELDSYFDWRCPTSRPAAVRRPRRSGRFLPGYPELTPEGRHFNTSILVDSGEPSVGKYRKIHLPARRQGRRRPRAAPRETLLRIGISASGFRGRRLRIGSACATTVAGRRSIACLHCRA